MMIAYTTLADCHAVKTTEYTKLGFATKVLLHCGPSCVGWLPHLRTKWFFGTKFYCRRAIAEGS